MRDDPLTIQDLSTAEHMRVLKLTGPLTITNLSDFQKLVRSDSSPRLILDLTNVPYLDSAGVGALVGAYAHHQKTGQSVTLVGVNERVRGLLKIMQADKFFQFVDSMSQVA